MDYVAKCLSPESFRAAKAMLVSAWLEHAPFAFWLIDAHRPQTLVELGTHYGFSYLCFCQEVLELDLTTRCFAVDTWHGDAHALFYGDEVFSDFQGYHDPRYGK